MSTPSTEHEKIAYSDHVDLEGGAPLGRAVTYQLSESQFEKLYLQPGGAQAKGDLTKRFGNPTALGVASFLLCLTPFSCELMGCACLSSPDIPSPLPPMLRCHGERVACFPHSPEPR